MEPQTANPRERLDHRLGRAISAIDANPIRGTTLSGPYTRRDALMHIAPASLVSVDSLSGRIVGRAAGATRVTPTGGRFGTGKAVTVTVQ